MGTIADKLVYLQGTKSAIKNAIVSKGVTVPTGTSFRDYATKIGNITTGGGTPTADPYVRPAEWLALPPNVNGVEKVSILKSVFDTDSEFTAFTCQGNYTVDWGDGTVENFTSNTKAEHKYDYSNINLNSDTVSKFGYKQCVITITPQSGQTLTKCLLNQYHTSISNSYSYNMNSGFLDININLPNVTSTSNFGIGTLFIGSASSCVNMSSLERVSIGQIGLIDLSYLFYNCYSIQEILFDFDTSIIKSWTNTFFGCYSLQKCPTIVFNPSGVLSVASMFSGCYSLVEIQDINITIVSNIIESMFSGCYRLTKLVLNITSSVNLSFVNLFQNCYGLSDLILTLSGEGKVTNLNSTFQNCYSLTEAPVLDTSACTSFSGTFSNSGIVVAPDYNYLSATALNSCYSGCKSLVYVPDITVSSACTNLSSLFSSCSALGKAPNITGTTNVTTVSGMLSSCISLISVPTYDFPAITGTGANTIFPGCSSLKVISPINIGTAFTSNGNTVSANYALARMLMPLKYTFSVANAKMSAAALNEMFSILPTVTDQTVTVTGNYGASTCDTTIATAKGWTVVT